MDLIITPRLVIPSRELKWRFSRSSGPGGQKVNKTDSSVERNFNIKESKVLNVYQNIVIIKKLRKKISQLINRQLALERISSLTRNS